ncbi:hypothetical protein SAMN05216480_10499 [Pustulibacterium marinum]|uniref:Uncharacterized protein n=1 Tax=Pustulibacterium marinum TaxID=1224947 RepID=A0A1I7GCN2_9FLAO|nr:DUF6095 family protein [Pustulibacterium marinum]SFU46178.1 hypothetical protein SAMN05216480_10499 [Pustulibacterium marinum]
MPTEHSNRELIKKGVTRMVAMVSLFFLGPIVIHSSFKNTDKPLFIPVLIIGILICFIGVYQAFKGLQIVMKALFNDSDKK